VNDQELREMIRESIARHLRSGGDRSASHMQAPDVPEPHASHALLPLLRGDDEGACLIEPAVRCNHCGYCLSYGH
jgi:hypothetical protein